jgi:hypothetical protein
VDADRFDTLARALRTTPTRRLTLGALTALGLAALLGDAGTDAKPGGGKKGKGKKGKGKKGGDNKKKKKKTTPPTNTNAVCRFDSDCNGHANGPLCCDNNPPYFECAQCCSAGNRGCTSPQYCSTEDGDTYHCYG